MFTLWHVVTHTCIWAYTPLQCLLNSLYSIVDIYIVFNIELRSRVTIHYTIAITIYLPTYRETINQMLTHDEIADIYNLA